MAALRSTSLKALALAAVLAALAPLAAPSLARAAEPCAWRHPGKAPPDFVLGELERELTRRGDVVVLRKPLPMSQLCSTSKVWAFELWGRGELMQAAGGGRTTFTLRCRR